jgi:5-methyltetrahydropteroyltriglutamate--homocysteine methyltransferase
MANLKNIRTDVVGSLQRPPGLKEARSQFDEGKITADALRALEDDAVRAAVRLQEDVGLDILTDGEMRRLNFQDSFGEAVEGYDASRSTVKGYERRVEGSAPGQRWEIPTMHQSGTAVSHRRPTKEKLRLARNVPLEEYEFVAKVAKTPAKVSLIGPDRISQRFDYQASRGVYDGLDDFVDDVVRIERQIVESLVKAGCRYIHIDAPGFTAYVDTPTMDQMRARGEDPMQNFSRSLKAESKVVENLGEVATGIHLCRGNQRSMWHREGTYDAIAERLFNELSHDRFLLEYDTPRAGSFEPLRFVPKGKVVVLGLVSTKTAEMEKVDDLKRRIGEASKFIPLDQLAISPQCGFASDVVGNLISADQQKRKLELVVETARQVWG